MYVTGSHLVQTCNMPLLQNGVEPLDFPADAVLLHREQQVLFTFKQAKIAGVLGFETRKRTVDYEIWSWDLRQFQDYILSSKERILVPGDPIIVRKVGVTGPDSVDEWMPERLQAGESLTVKMPSSSSSSPARSPVPYRLPSKAQSPVAGSSTGHGTLEGDRLKLKRKAMSVPNDCANLKKRRKETREIEIYDSDVIILSSDSDDD